MLYFTAIKGEEYPVDELYKYICELRTVDCHEHLLYPSVRRKEKTDLFGLLHYLESDMVSSGMKHSLNDRNLDKETKYNIFLENFKNVKNTAYAKVINIFAKDLYGIEEINEKTLPKLDRLIQLKSNDDSWYEEVLVNKALIDKAIVVDDGSFEKHHVLKPMMYFDFLMKREHIKWLNKENLSKGKKAATFEMYCDYVEEFCSACLDKGIVAGKFALPYWRSLKLDYYDLSLAKEEFENNNDDGDSINFQNYIFNLIIRFFSKKDIPIQLHTGHVEPSGCIGKQNIKNSRSADLIPLLLNYPDTKFVLLHGGFPYQNEYLSIAKSFPNVWMDLSWIYVISPTIAKNILFSAIEMVPQNKIIGFGGDYEHVENIYGHSVIARRVISSVLKEKVQEGYFDMEEAKKFAELILRDNGKNLYKL